VSINDLLSKEEIDSLATVIIIESLKKDKIVDSENVMKLAKRFNVSYKAIMLVI